MRTQPITIVDNPENCTKYLLTFSFVSLLFEKKKTNSIFFFIASSTQFTHSHLVRLLRFIFYRKPTKIVQWTRFIFLCVSVRERAATAAICNNLALLPLGNCIWKHFSIVLFFIVAVRFVWWVVWYTLCNWINENCFEWHLFTFNFSVPLQYLFKCKAKYELVWILLLFCVCRWEWNCKRRRHDCTLQQPRKIQIFGFNLFSVAHILLCGYFH